MNPLKINKLSIIVLLGMFLLTMVYARQDVFPPSFNPPNGMALEKVPQLVCFGFDDNNYGDGMNWILDFLKEKKNPAGNGNPLTFDSKPVKVTFYIKAMIESSEPEQDVLNSWKKAYQSGHEIGNHTYQHIAVDIKNEVRKCDSVLQTLGVPLAEIIGFRTPQLAIVSSVFDEIYKRKFLYDCTVEHHTAAEGGKFIWPYTLEKGMDVNTAFGGLTASYPGMWELPVHEFVTASGGKITTGLDFNAFINSGMGGAAFCNALKGSLTYHSKTNKCPLFIGMHSDLYAKTNVSSGTATDRRKGVEDFINYALIQNDVRIVPMKDVITWMRNPVGLGQTSVAVPVLVQSKTVLVRQVNTTAISLVSSAPGTYTINLFSLSGKKIFSDNISIAPGGQAYTCSFKGMGLKGNYILAVTGGGIYLQKRLLVL